MDQETRENKGSFGGLCQDIPGISESSFGSLSQVSPGISENLAGYSINSNNGVVLEAVIVLDSGQTVSSGGESGIFNASTVGLGSSDGVKNQESNDGRGMGESVSERNGRNLGDLVDGIVLESIVVVNPGRTAYAPGEKKELAANTDKIGTSDGAKVQDTHGGPGNGEALNQAVEGNAGISSVSVDADEREPAIATNSVEYVDISGQNDMLEVKGNELGSIEATVDESKPKAPKGEKALSLGDVKCDTVNGRGDLKDNRDHESVCRICHLGSEGSVEAAAASTTATSISMDLNQLSCGCKDELGIAHVHCAEAWFKLKGNRKCEICGEMAKNITGVGDNRFMGQWNQRRLLYSSTGSSDRGGGYWHRQPFCNFLMALLVITFVLPWVFQVNMF